MATTLMVGGIRSGKSALSQRYAESIGRQCLYVATASSCLASADPALQARIAAHQAVRGARWHTYECPRLHLADLPVKNIDVVLIDCLGLWLAHLFYEAEQQALNAIQTEGMVEKAIESFISQVQTFPLPLIMVSSEVGQGILPMQAQSRAFCDGLGLINQRVAQICTEVILVSCGLPLALKGTLPYIFLDR